MRETPRSAERCASDLVAFKIFSPQPLPCVRPREDFLEGLSGRSDATLAVSRGASILEAAELRLLLPAARHIRADALPDEPPGLPALGSSPLLLLEGKHPYGHEGVHCGHRSLGQVIAEHSGLAAACPEDTPGDGSEPERLLTEGLAAAGELGSSVPAGFSLDRLMELPSKRPLCPVKGSAHGL
ncbi:hypothetical protein J1605_009141 [Eschrichtius robustus]|uniref:Uncharacterized protein n=1 Tax=Eschrichtius robustus TaxID=9764 RepID=A0AB34GVD0_ESCRO|nr:hypothetical protein J1605_009141 [Eschrichtius robustus]